MIDRAGGGEGGGDLTVEYPTLHSSPLSVSLPPKTGIDISLIEMEELNLSPPAPSNVVTESKLLVSFFDYLIFPSPFSSDWGVVNVFFPRSLFL